MDHNYTVEFGRVGITTDMYQVFCNGVYTGAYCKTLADAEMAIWDFKRDDYFYTGEPVGDIN